MVDAARATLGVVVERLDNLRDDVADLRKDLAEKYATREGQDNDRARIGKLEATYSRIVRTGLGFVFTTISGVIAALVSVHR